MDPCVPKFCEKHGQRELAIVIVYTHLPLQGQQYLSCLVPRSTNPSPSMYFEYDVECGLRSIQAQQLSVAVSRHDVGSLWMQCSGNRAGLAVSVAIRP